MFMLIGIPGLPAAPAPSQFMGSRKKTQGGNSPPSLWAWRSIASWPSFYRCISYHWFMNSIQGFLLYSVGRIKKSAPTPFSLEAKVKHVLFLFNIVLSFCWLVLFRYLPFSLSTIFYFYLKTISASREFQRFRFMAT